MNKLGPVSAYFPARPFEPSPAFCAWLDLMGEYVPMVDRLPVDELMAHHARFQAKQAKAAAKRGRV